MRVVGSAERRRAGLLAGVALLASAVVAAAWHGAPALHVLAAETVTGGDADPAGIRAAAIVTAAAARGPGDPVVHVPGEDARNRSRVEVAVCPDVTVARRSDWGDEQPNYYLPDGTVIAHNVPLSEMEQLSSDLHDLRRSMGRRRLGATAAEAEAERCDQRQRAIAMLTRYLEIGAREADAPGQLRLLARDLRAMGRSHEARAAIDRFGPRLDVPAAEVDRLRIMHHAACEEWLVVIETGRRILNEGADLSLGSFVRMQMAFAYEALGDEVSSRHLRAQLADGLARPANR